MQISVLQWNVQSSEDIHKIGHFLKRYQADVVCLQELTVDYELQTVSNTPAYIAKILNYYYFTHEIPSNDASTDARLVNGIFSRFPIENRFSTIINDAVYGGGFDSQERAYVEVGINCDGTFVSVGTTHMSYTNGFEDTPTKRAETDRLVAVLAKRHKRFIFTGDLNATPESYTVASIEQHLRNAGPVTTQATWTTKPFNYQNFTASELSWRLDYIFVSPDMHVVAAHVLETECSDHLPILAKVDV
jgi:endonuclease/exonuclease/phosphatase family metal-dependent hydrolase